MHYSYSYSYSHEILARTSPRRSTVRVELLLVMPPSAYSLVTSSSQSLFSLYTASCSCFRSRFYFCSCSFNTYSSRQITVSDPEYAAALPFSRHLRCPFRHGRARRHQAQSPPERLCAHALRHGQYRCNVQAPEQHRRYGQWPLAFYSILPHGSGARHVCT